MNSKLRCRLAEGHKTVFGHLTTRFALVRKLEKCTQMNLES